MPAMWPTFIPNLAGDIAGQTLQNLVVHGIYVPKLELIKCLFFLHLDNKINKPVIH